MDIQAVAFPKSGWAEREAATELGRHGLSSAKPAHTTNYWRFVQHAESAYPVGQKFEVEKGTLAGDKPVSFVRPLGWFDSSLAGRAAMMFPNPLNRLDDRQRRTLGILLGPGGDTSVKSLMSDLGVNRLTAEDLHAALYDEHQDRGITVGTPNPPVSPHYMEGDPARSPEYGGGHPDYPESTQTWAETEADSDVEPNSTVHLTTLALGPASWRWTALLYDNGTREEKWVHSGIAESLEAAQGAAVDYAVSARWLDQDTAYVEWDRLNPRSQNPPTPAVYHDLLLQSLLVYDRGRRAKGDVNDYRLSHLQEAAERALRSVGAGNENRSDPSVLESYRAGLRFNFTEGFPPVQRVLRLLDHELAVRPAPGVRATTGVQEGFGWAQQASVPAAGQGSLFGNPTERSWAYNAPGAPWTIWGRADNAVDLAPGVTWYSTPSHGGFAITVDKAPRYLTPAAIAAGHRGRSMLWYEEDLDATIPLLEQPGWAVDLGITADPAQLRAELRAVAARYLPEYWQASGMADYFGKESGTAAPQVDAAGQYKLFNPRSRRGPGRHKLQWQGSGGFFEARPGVDDWRKYSWRYSVTGGHGFWRAVLDRRADPSGADSELIGTGRTSNEAKALAQEHSDLLPDERGTAPIPAGNPSSSSDVLAQTQRAIDLIVAEPRQNWAIDLQPQLIILVGAPASGKGWFVDNIILHKASASERRGRAKGTARSWKGAAHKATRDPKTTFAGAFPRLMQGTPAVSESDSYLRHLQREAKGQDFERLRSALDDETFRSVASDIWYQVDADRVGIIESVGGLDSLRTAVAAGPDDFSRLANDFYRSMRGRHDDGESFKVKARAAFEGGIGTVVSRYGDTIVIDSAGEDILDTDWPSILATAQRANFMTTLLWLNAPLSLSLARNEFRALTGDRKVPVSQTTAAYRNMVTALRQIAADPGLDRFVEYRWNAPSGAQAGWERDPGGPASAWSGGRVGDGRPKVPSLYAFQGKWTLHQDVRTHLTRQLGRQAQVPVEAQA